MADDTKPRGMESLVDLINKIQDAFTKAGIPNPIDLPQIVVVGSQSSGKSSVLENLVLRDFLPRGGGIVTRRPLVLQLIHRPSKEEEEWGEFLHLPGQRYTDFDAIRDEIILDTELKAGKTKGVSPIPINLRIYSPYVPTLTLVDLPGLTKVPVGDQPRDIERQIRDMNMKYISNKNAIILAVTAANTDLANSDSLKLARDVDPDGFRTLGVLTKVDLMDKGTDVLDILTGKVIPLQQGYIPVVNRGQKDIETNIKISIALERENTFFETHPSYQTRARFCGTSYLSKKLSNTLMKHIKKNIPEIKTRISVLLEKYKRELESLGQDTFGESHNVFLTIISEFSTGFRQILDGNLQDISKNELCGGARVGYIFHDLFAKTIMNIDPLEKIKEQDIRTLLYNSSGSTPALFVSTQSFEVLIKQLVITLQEPGIKCISLVYDELVKILHQLLSSPSFKRFPLLKEKVYHEVMALYKKWTEPTKELVTDIVHAEGCYVNTAHPDFIGGQRAMAEASLRVTQKEKKTTGAATAAQPAKRGIFDTFSSTSTKQNSPGVLEAPPTILKATGASSEREVVEIEVIKILIESYFNVVKKTVADIVPKTIMLKLVVLAKENIQKELLKTMYNTETLDKLLAESEEVVERRKECVNMVKALMEADEIIGSV